MNFFGHRLHPMLVAFPVGLLVTSVAFDIIFLATDNPEWAHISYWIIAGGIVGGLVAALFGVMDWSHIPSGTRAKSVGVIHGTVNATGIALFGASWLIRFNGVPEEPGGLSIALAFVGAGILTVGGWLGRELVEQMGIGVNRDANPDAPNSLRSGQRSRRPSP